MFSRHHTTNPLKLQPWTPPSPSPPPPKKKTLDNHFQVWHPQNLSEHEKKSVDSSLQPFLHVLYLLVTIICENKIFRYRNCDDFAGIIFLRFHEVKMNFAIHPIKVQLLELPLAMLWK